MTESPKVSTEQNIASPWTEEPGREAGSSTEKSTTEQSAGDFSVYIKSGLYINAKLVILKYLGSPFTWDKVLKVLGL